MTNLALTAQWHDAINQVETSDDIVGGANGNANLATKQLAENLLWLKQQFEQKKHEPISVGGILHHAIYTTPEQVAKGEGYGTWQRIAEGRVLIGAGTGTDSNNKSLSFSMAKTGGEYNHSLTIDEMPKHTHEFPVPTKNLLGDFEESTLRAKQIEHVLRYDEGATYDNFIVKPNDSWSHTGSSLSHNNMQPYYAIGIWKRTA